MYKIGDFKVGDKIYQHKNNEWQFCGEICKVTDQCYGVRSKLIVGMFMVDKNLFESTGYIGKPFGFK